MTTYEEIEGTWLVRSPCLGCGVKVLTTAKHAGKGRCESCGRRHHGAVGVYGAGHAEALKRSRHPGDVTPTMSLETRDRREREAITPLEPHPEPEVPCRNAEPQEIPKSAAKLASTAATLGWETRVTYARGWKPVRNRQPKLVESVAVRLRRGDQCAIALWEDGKTDCGFIWGVGQPLRKESVTGVVNHVKGV